MKKILLTSALALIVGTGMARAEMTAQQIVDLHPGAQSIRIERGVARTKVYVTINGQVTEVIYDNATDQGSGAARRHRAQAQAVMTTMATTIAMAPTTMTTATTTKAMAAATATRAGVVMTMTMTATTMAAMTMKAMTMTTTTKV